MMPNNFTISFIIIYVIESLIIIIQSSLIVAVLGREWVQVKRLSPVDMILTSLGFCRFNLQWLSMLCDFLMYAKPKHTHWNLTTIWEFINILTFWLTSLLAVYYCVKVSSFTHHVFLWLRWRILRLVPWLLLGSLVISCVTIIPSAIRTHIRFRLITLQHLPSNSTLIERLHGFERLFDRPHKLIALCVPFLLFLTSIILLMASLAQHREQMQHHDTGQGNSSMKAHGAALKSLSIFLVFFTSYFLALLVSFLGTIFDSRHWFWLWEAVIYALVCVHSISLILTSPTLKRVLKVKCWA
ncbi:taste receptor type 2 member 16 [Ochotona curzoniae]|uniref:taste receptor type 2 member 16 n=1 Tax=Ochotona curzoniae TaxID=130825 RepID=UPI001B34604A|nr:taste receptor type 2 member 16 [Ochotona curzoniae]